MCFHLSEILKVVKVIETENTVVAVMRQGAGDVGSCEGESLGFAI